MVFVIVFVFSFVLRLRRLFLVAGVMAVHWCAGRNFTINMLPQQPLLCDRIHHQRHSKEIFTFASVWSRGGTRLSSERDHSQKNSSLWRLSMNNRHKRECSAVDFAAKCHPYCQPARARHCLWSSPAASSHQVCWIFFTWREMNHAFQCLAEISFRYKQYVKVRLQW